jgi:hypothetical protein
MGKFSSRVMQRMMASCWKSFSPKEGHIGLHDVEQLADHAADAVKMTGTVRAAQAPCPIRLTWTLVLGSNRWRTFRVACGGK